MMMLDLEAGPARVRIDPEHGGRVASLRVAGFELLRSERDDALRWGSYPMAPFAGRVRRGRFRFGGREYALPLRMPPHAIHGTTLDRTWHVVGDGVLSIELGPDWPFPGHAVQRFAIDPDGLDLRLEVHAETEPFPASLGFHPWFVRRLSRGGELELDFRAARMFVRDQDGIPSRRTVHPPLRPWDDCFTDLAEPPRLRWPGAVALELTASTPYWVVYDEPADALCVEPLTAPPDALEAADDVVEPGRPLVLDARFAWTLD